LTYCPLCTPQIGITEDTEYVIVRYYPESEMDLDSMQTRTFELETGVHIIYEGWFKALPQIEENMITYQVCHPMKDWRIKHMLNPEEMSKEDKLISEILNK